jgi:hypothetical protein
VAVECCSKLVMGATLAFCMMVSCCYRQIADMVCLQGLDTGTELAEQMEGDQPLYFFFFYGGRPIYNFIFFYRQIFFFFFFFQRVG